MKYKSLFILLLLIGYGIHASAQLRLIDSLSVNDSMIFIANYEKEGIDKRFYAQISRIPGQMSTIFRGDKIPISYPATTELLYIDQHTAITFESKGNPAVDEALKYSYIYRCIPTENGTLNKIDSIAIDAYHLAYSSYNRIISTNRYIITFPAAVEGGTCIEEYEVYNLDLKKMGTVKPDLTTCGVRNKIVYNNNGLDFISRDALVENMISWCTTDNIIQNKYHNRIIIDTLFKPLRHFVLEKQLYVTCIPSKKSGQKLKYVTYVYDSKGRLVDQIQSDHFFYEDMYKTTNGYLGIDETKKEVSILNNRYKQISQIQLPGRNTIIKNYLYSTTPTKVYIYEIN